MSKNIWTRAENSGGWIGNDKNSGGEHSRSVNGHSCMGRFVRHHPTTVTGKILPSHLLLDFLVVSSFEAFQPTLLYDFFIFPTQTAAHPILLDLMTLIANIWWIVQIMEVFIMKFFIASCHSGLLRSKYSPKQIYSQTPSVCVLPLIETGQVPHKFSYHWRKNVTASLHKLSPSSV
jgi:hypothetical protein